jgi:serine/threonine protein kinase
MPIAPGSRFGPYEVVSPLGAGGMGEVYRARDTRLGRTVAIKILPETLARDSGLRERFDREARTIAKLDHPHICPLYDVGIDGETAFLVMQCLEGETLANRLKAGPLPLNRALEYGIEIADALDQAHRLGIVHRDLKPSNIFLTKTGAMLLDFGLAKPRPNIVPDEPSILTRTTDDLTARGTILGTLPYMAPEQLEGREADARADIFSFGAVLYEMLTGRKAFEGASPASLIAAIIQSEPRPISSLQAQVPALVEHIVTRCLAKSRDDRWQTAGDLMHELKWAAHGATESLQSATATGVASKVAFWRRVAVAGGLVAVSSIVLATYLAMKSPPQVGDQMIRQVPIRVSISPSENTQLSSVQLALSPDGMNVAYIGLAGQQRQVWIYSLSGGESRILAEADDATFPFWSPDSRHVGFFTSRGLVRLPAAGGPIQNLAPASMDSSGTWSEEGVLLFAGRDKPGIYRTTAGGGSPMPVTTLDASREEILHLHPRFLPGGRKFLYLAQSRTPDHTGIYVRSLDVDDRKFLIQTTTHAEYSPPGLLLFVRESVLMAQRFDLSRLGVEGEPMPIAPDVNANVDNGGAGFSVGRDGSLVYHAGQIPAALKWLDRHGAVTSTLALHAVFREVELSPDWTKVLVRIRPKESTLRGDIWTIDLSRAISSRVTVDAGSLNARWAADGKSVFFDSSRPGQTPGIYRKRSDGTGSAELVWKTEGRLADVSRNGCVLIEVERACTVIEPGPQPASTRHIPDLGDRLATGRSLMPAIPTSSSSCGRFSDDSRLIAYTLDVSGRPEVYVVPFPEGAPRIQISRDGGREPRWRKDGRELFYLSPDGTMMAATLSRGPTLQASSPIELFHGGALTSGSYPTYSVSSDGQRFLMIDPVGDPHADRLTVITHWIETLKQLTVH